jgi:hypothetical protein
LRGFFILYCKHTNFKDLEEKKMGNANSGRRSNGDVERRRNVIQYAWKKAHEVFEGKTISPQQFEMTKAIVVKSIPDEQRLTINGGDELAERVNRVRQALIDAANGQ